MGTPEFAVPSLKALIDNNYNVVGVITAPDKEAGRGKKVKMSAVKIFAQNNDLVVLQPYKFKDDAFLQQLRSLNADLQIVVAFRMLPEVVWAMPRLGTFNLHASLLPQYRGAAPINFAIINGEKTTGLTTFFLDKNIDTGKIIKQEKVDIKSTDDVGTLHDKMMTTGSDLIIRTVDIILEGKTKLMEQSSFVEENEIIKNASKIEKEFCSIDWNNEPENIYNFVRGLSPYPAAFSTLYSPQEIKQNIKIYKVSIVSQKNNTDPTGTIITDGKTYMNVVTKSGLVSILELQLSGKKRMKIEDFLRGFQNIVEYRLL
jgi:methionyl-tRNA formyltransferase